MDTEIKEQKKGFIATVKHIYETKYKLLLAITLFIFFLALVQIGYQVATTGDFVQKGVSIKGGLTITIISDKNLDYNSISKELQNQLGKDTAVKLVTIGSKTSFIIESGINDKDAVEKFVSQVEKITGMKRNTFSIEVTGPSLGQTFFRDTITALIIAFIAMGAVVFLYFRIPIPSLAVMLSASADILITLAVVNLLGIKLSTAGIVAFLLLIGYSVDTDMLLTIKVLKRKEGKTMDRVYGALKIGTMMTFASLAAVLVGLLFSRSEVITQIMLILLIGLFVDLFTTWIQNVGLLRLYLEKKGKHD